MEKFYINYENTPFLKTSKTTPFVNRLNWRCEILLTRNQDAIKGKKILDLISQDDRFSYACLKLGASHVTGIEGRPHLVKNARKNLINLGFEQKNFTFIQNNSFNYLPKIKQKEFDTILCFGFFYHTIRQIELLREIMRILPKYFLLNTQIIKELIVFELANLTPKNISRHFIRINQAAKKLKRIADEIRQIILVWCLDAKTIR